MSDQHRKIDRKIIPRDCRRAQIWTRIWIHRGSGPASGWHRFHRRRAARRPASACDNPGLAPFVLLSESALGFFWLRNLSFHKGSDSSQTLSRLFFPTLGEKFTLVRRKNERFFFKYLVSKLRNLHEICNHIRITIGQKLFPALLFSNKRWRYFISIRFCGECQSRKFLKPPISILIYLFLLLQLPLDGLLSLAFQPSPLLDPRPVLGSALLVLPFLFLAQSSIRFPFSPKQVVSHCE